MFSVHTKSEVFKNATITGSFGFDEDSVREIIGITSKSSVFKMFSVHTKTKTQRFQILQFEERFIK